MNPESLDSSIQSALSSLFPPFEATAPVVLSQLFRTIEERYRGDALQCLLDFLIPSKHLLESVQQAACAGFSDVLFRCEGWPLCLHDKTVVQLAPVNALLLRPGDFYLQVEPFGDQAARIVLKSLLEDGCREVEETPLPETSYPCIFTEAWLQDINDGRHGTPLARCLLCTDQGVIKLPWAKIAIPEFLDRPKIMPTHREAPPEPKRTAPPSRYHSSTLPVEALIFPAKDRISGCLRPADCSSRLVKMQHDKQSPKSSSKPLTKPVGWVSPNTWDSRNYREMEGDYVDLVDICKEEERGHQQRDSHPCPPESAVVRPVRPPPPVPLGRGVPRSQAKLGPELTDQDLKCRYRDSYLAALRNPVTFERGSVDLLSALDEVGLCEEGDLGSGRTREAPRSELGNICNHSKEAVVHHELWQHKHCAPPTPEHFPSHPKDLPANSGTESLMKQPALILKSTPGLNHSHRVATKLFSHQLGHNAHGSDVFLENCGDAKAHQKAEAVKASGKHKFKVRSLSTVSETPKGSPLLYNVNNRSHSDVCPETITSLIHSKKGELLDQVIPKLERLAGKSPKKELQSGRSQGPSITDGADSEPPPHLHVQLPSAPSDNRWSPLTEESSFKNISSLLELGIICLTGSRDRTGRAVVEVHGDRKEWASPFVSAQNLCESLLYLHSLPRKDVGELGMTLVINARKKPPPSHLYKALLMAQEQALHAVHSVVMLMDKDTCPRPEKQPGLQMDVVTSMKALNKTVEASQLTPELGGSFVYSHTDWLQFHQRLVSFVADLRGADGLLQKAIGKVDSGKKLDTAEDVQLCIQEQRASMKEVLEDLQLVTLQREGGALLAKMRREEFRFPQSEDFRDALESVTILYNQVEEKLHMLVMRSNGSLQQLELLFGLREMEAKLSTAGLWFSTEGEERLKESYAAGDTLPCTQEALQHFEVFLAQSKENRQNAVALVTEAEQLVGSTDSSPTTDVFRTLVSTFKSNVDDFMLRVEQRHKELKRLEHVYGFCLKAAAFCRECSHFLGQVDQGCSSAQTLSALQMYDERLAGEFSAPRFQAAKAEACAVGSGASGAVGVWNAAWLRCQEVRQHLEEHKKKNGVDKNQTQHPATAGPRGTAGDKEEGEAGAEVGEEECSPTQTSSHEETERARERSADDLKEQPHHQKSHKERPRNEETGPVSPPSRCDAAGRSRREHHSEADLRTDSSGAAGGVAPHRALGRSLSEGSGALSRVASLVSGFAPLNVRHKHCVLRGRPAPHDGALQPGNPSWESKRDGSEGTASAQSPEDSTTPETLLTAEDNGTNVLKLRRIMEELLSTEREYVKALGYVREHYFPELERPDVPQDLRGQRGSVFGNLEKLHDFHRLHFLSELESCVQEAFRVGRCFLRHRESFALYALYSKNKPQSDRLLINHGQAFFKQKQAALGDKMDLWSYLLKPVQRISKYSLLLQDMMRECSPAQTRELAEIKAALEVVHFQLRHGNNLLAMDAIQHCDVNLKEQGQLIRQDELLITFRRKKCFRHVFLFQELVLFSKTRKTDVGNETYIYKQSFKTSDIGMTQNSGDSGLCFEIWFRKRKTEDTYTLQAVSREAKEAWTEDLERILWEQAVHNREVRMQERVFMGIGNKPFMDIQPSDAAICDRAVNCVLLGRVDSSESSGESVSGFSSSGHSAVGGEAEEASGADAAAAERREASAASHKPSAREGSPEKSQPPVAPESKAKPQQTRGKNNNTGKSTEV
ncbi:quattro isoform X2 [Betta splendens]|uniref:Quattro isoform X2 n=1 Tax=Betta splendens TaxID=158456 RepID=A0A9W2XTY8_BETSP|nr:quattro isoform X2 [Betta splendens]